MESAPGKPGSIKIARLDVRTRVVVAWAVRTASVSPQSLLRSSVPMLMMSTRTEDMATRYEGGMKRQRDVRFCIAKIPAAIVAALTLVGCAATSSSNRAWDGPTTVQPARSEAWHYRDQAGRGL